MVLMCVLINKARDLTRKIFGKKIKTKTLTKKERVIPK